MHVITVVTVLRKSLSTKYQFCNVLRILRPLLHVLSFFLQFSCVYIAMIRMRESTEYQKSVVIQKTKICNYGEARYIIENALNNVSGYDLTEEFKNAVRLLPSNYSVNTYVRFLDDWGTVSEANSAWHDL